MHARVGGEGCAGTSLVLVHGWGVSSRYMVPLAACLAREFRVYAVDLPGHGRSDTPPRALDVPGLAAALAEWMKAAGLERAALIGHSLGCQVVAELAARHPGRVSRLVMIGPTLDPQARTLGWQMARFLATAVFEPPSLALLLLLDYCRMGPRALRELRHMFAHRIEEVLPLLSAPALIVRGSRDRIVPQRWAEEAGRLARAPVLTVPGRGHAVNYSAPVELSRIVSPFLRASTGAGP